ncbi:MAG: ribonuclease H-like domain-containing protein [Anaerolineaceae bacterium]
MAAKLKRWHSWKGYIEMDWQSLTEKLRKMGVQVGLEKPLDSTGKISRPIERVVAGREVATHYGSIFSSDHHYQADYLHGNQPIIPTQPISRIAQWARVPQLESESLENLIFLDTETTGLSGGTGTMAFMVGVGRYRASEFVMEQFFLREPADEAALLAGLSEFCDSMGAVVTYNGKAFDIPILNTRYILQGFTSPFEDLPHFDLLHLTRRVWKARLEHCNLGNIEQQVLDLRRGGDEVPGYLVPEYYSQYLRNGDAQPLKGIFYHNELDVLSLAALFALLTDILGNPIEWQNPCYQDITSVGRLLEKMGNLDQASEMYQKGAVIENTGTLRLEPVLYQARLLKKNQQLELALPLWMQAAEVRSLEALEELAKYYEHTLKDPKLALSFVDQAISQLETDPHLPGMNKYLLAFTHRKTRLLTKMGGTATETSD